MGLLNRNDSHVIKIKEFEARPGVGRQKKDTYVHVRKIGAGGQGETTVVKRKRDDAILVRKTQKIFDMQGDVPREMLIFEDILIPHRSIVKFDHCNFIEKEGTLVLYFEHCEGGDLSKWIPRANKVPEDFIWHVFIQLAEALKFLHYGLGKHTTPHRGWRRVVHRDVKPHNVFLRRPITSKDPIPDLVLGDFGLATLREESSSCGTPEWVGPEVLSPGKVTKQSDVWGLGSIIHALAHGHGPVTSPPDDWKGTGSDWLNSAKSRKARQMSTFYSKNLNRNMLDCLEIDPLKRISSKDLAHNLRRERPDHLYK